MRATLTLNLVNKEAMHFFTKRLKNGDTLYEAAIRKVNLLLKKSIDYNACALLTLVSLDEKIKQSTEYLYDELDKFEGQLEKRQFPGLKKVQFIPQFSPDVSCSNPVSVSLIEWVEVFDKLVSTLKLLNLSGCFESMEAFYAVKRRFQKQANRLLSSISLQATTSMASESIQEIIESDEDYDWPRLYEALQSPHSPGFSPSLKNQLLYKIKQKQSIENNNQAKETLC